ncbi:MAG: hypothetical protein Q8Q73_03485 [Stagnimonas sp.]|nr:hypothetical protein [Stagnimonas sp.]
MNELFLAMAEERRLKAEREARTTGGRRVPPQPVLLSPTWGQRLFQVLGYVPKLRI